ncbi:MAG TPA: type II toxin-antitoxin system VapC family toxin [Candidatus Competibacter sp.]|nr:type II toxin-antitoxin system VapC family toxin [Candidatus Competibacter sp.]
MLAVDTNVIVRIVTNDDPEQAQRAVTLFERERIFIAKTVLLEVEWVLRFSYHLPRGIIAPTLRKVVGLQQVEVENPDEIFIALDGYEQGLDFADALHLASSGRAEGFATFDQKMAKRASQFLATKMVVV